MFLARRANRLLIEPGEVARLHELYERGLFLQAWQHVISLGPILDWAGTEAQIIAGRLANRLFAPTLGAFLANRAYREDRPNPLAVYFRGLTIFNRHGPLPAWSFLE